MHKRKYCIDKDDCCTVKPVTCPQFCRLRSAFGIVITLLCLSPLVYALIKPSTEMWYIDTTFPLVTNRLVLSLLVCEIFFCYALFLLQQYRYLPCAILLIVASPFIISLTVQAISIPQTEYQLSIINIAFGYALFSLFSFVSSSFPRLRELYPKLLYGIAIYYALAILFPGMFTRFYKTGKVYWFHGSPRLSVIFNNPNHLGNLLAFIALYCFAIFLVEKRKQYMIPLWILFSILLYGLILTFSRGAWMAFTVGIMITLLFAYNRVNMPKLGITILLLVITASGIIYVTKTMMLAQIRVSRALPGADNAVNNRLAIWNSALAMVYDHPWLGVGFGRFGEMLDKGYKPAHLSKLSYGSAMNNYLTLIAEAGIPVAISYMLVLLIVCRLCFITVVKKKEHSGEMIGLFSGVISLILFGLTTYTLGHVYANMLLWGSLGYLVSYRPLVEIGVVRNQNDPVKHCCPR